MKILITTDLYTVQTNGVVTSVRNLCDELSARGHDVRILTLSDTMRSRKRGNEYFIRSLPIGVVYPGVRMPTSFHHRLIRELIAWKPDVIHSQCEFFSFQFAKYISERTGAPIVHTYHTLYEQYVGYLFPSRRLGRFVVRAASRRRLKRVNRVIAPTPKVESALRSYKISKGISVVPSGISLEQHKLRLSAAERLEKRRRLGIADDAVVLLNLGRLGTEKNLDELLELFALAKAKNDSLVFLIVGDGPAREELEALAREKGITDSVIFTGKVPPAEVQDYYQLGDIFINASTSETQGLTYIEAAANGLPLICRKDPCLENVLVHAENGFAYTTPEEFVEYVLFAAGDERWRSSASKHSEAIAARFDKSRFGEAIESIYESVC